MGGGSEALSSGVSKTPSQPVVQGQPNVVSEATVEIEAIPRPKAAVKERSLLLELVKEEAVRAAVALLLILLLAGIAVGGFLKTKSWSDAHELLDILLPAVAGLLGSAIGFYFGRKND